MPVKKSKPNAPAKIAQAIRAHRRFLVASHIRPDRDAIGSLLAMGLMLKKLGKQVTLWNDDGVPPRYTFFRGSHLIQRTPPENSSPRQFDVVLALDTATYARLGRAGKLFRPKTLINIDHHESNERYGDLAWIKPHDAATSQMLYELFRSQKLPITPDIATALFVGIQTDTGSFHYSNSSPAVFRAAADLVELGANVGELGRLVYDTMPAARLRLLQLVLNSLHVSKDGRVAHFWLTQKMYKASGAHAEDTEDLINYARTIDSVVVAVLFEEIADKGKVRISLRSKSPKINASKITAKFGGGGHAGAAGATPKGKPGAIERAVLAEIRHAITNAKMGGRGSR